MLATTDPDEALDALVIEDIALVLSDQRMPRVSGVELLARAVRLRPETVRILLTGYTDVEALIRGVNDGRMYRYVTKPWDPTELLALVAEATTHHGQAMEKRRLLDELGRTAAREPLGVRRSAEPASAEPMAGENDLLRGALAELESSFWHLRKIEDVLPLCMGCGQVKSEAGTWSDVLTCMRKHASFLSRGYYDMNQASLHDRTALAAKMMGHKRAVAEEVTDEFFRRHPDRLVRYGELGRVRGLEDATFHVEFLAGAVEAGAAGPHEDYARWTVRMLEARGIGGSFVAENPSQVESALARHLSGEGERERWSRALPQPFVPARKASRRLSRSPGTRRSLDLVRKGMTVADLYADVTQQVLYEVGRLWESNGITVADEHMATATAQRCSPRSTRRRRSMRRSGGR